MEVVLVTDPRGLVSVDENRVTKIPIDSIADICRRHVSGERRVVDTIGATLEAIRRENPRLNAFTAIDDSGALAAAESLDNARDSMAEDRPLFGVPVAIKDNIDVAGLATTAGIRAYRDRRATDDAAVTACLRRAGAVIVGKTNLPEGALGATTTNELFGTSDHPHIAGLTPGGSSGGSAAAVASGLVPLAIGTDTLGSIRIPSAYCGIAGLKPSNGAISLSGIVPLDTTFDTVGPLAWRVEDLLAAFVAMAGQDVPADAPGRRHRLPGLRVVVAANAKALGCDDEIVRGYQNVCDTLSNLGAQIISKHFDWNLGQLRRHALLLVERSAAAVHREARQQKSDGFSASFAKMLDFGEQADARRIASARDTVAAHREAILALFADADLLLLPTAPQPPFPHSDPVPASQADLTALANIAGCPALSIPSGGVGARPVGVQLMMAPFNDWSLLRLGAAIEHHSVRPPR